MTNFDSVVKEVRGYFQWKSSKIGVKTEWTNGEQLRGPPTLEKRPCIVQ